MWSNDSVVGAALSQVPVAVVVVDADGRLVYANADASHLLGTTLGARHGSAAASGVVDGTEPAPRPVGRGRTGPALAEVFPLYAHEELAELLTSVTSDPEPVSRCVTVTGYRRTGGFLHIRITGRQLRGVPGLAGAVLTLEDATDAFIRATEEWVHPTRVPSAAKMAGILTRRELIHVVRRARPAVSGFPHSVVLVDVDRFKAVNDRYGHGTGDQVLLDVARVMKEVGGDYRCVGRVGGDQFVVLVPGGPSTAASVAETIVEKVADLRTQQSPDGWVQVTCSAGVAELGVDAAQSLREAEVALYHAKTRRNCVARFDQEVEPLQRRWLHMSQELQRYRESTQLLEADIARLHEESRIDALTRLGNRRRLDEDLVALHAESERSGQSYAVVFVDVDHFHDYNRELGDAAGDAALAEVATAITGICRSFEKPYRKGGEESVVLLRGDGDAARAAGERVRRAVQDAGIQHPATPEGVVTVSVGVALVRDCLDQPFDVLARAAMCMLTAKERGRNQVSTTPQPITRF